ncbi:terminase small subunit [Sphingobium sp. WCS2017Hpa-17]|uniref:terminase small subunit n=1 Tax=Sphingobium sp. WCS2017Hpa-17 TaxID=3073638 RepID=UPI0028891DC0|nr:terminase small subunit [Sphingobium sp. WCS2017Hpa-17]
MTPKQEKFCQLYVELGNASEAYRQSYSAERMKAPTINVKASQLLAQDKISVRVAELKAAHAERHNMTVDDIAKLLKEDRDFARKCETPAAAVSATMGLAKLYGHLRDKVDHTSSDGSMSPKGRTLDDFYSAE